MRDSTIQILVMMNSDKTITTTSKIVADSFGKEHRHVMRQIAKIIEEGGGDHFTASSYLSEQNKYLPCYEMNRGGFLLVAMCFTGPEALQWKLKYIDAFNRMEGALVQMNEKQLSESEKVAEEAALLKAKADREKAEGEYHAAQQQNARNVIEHSLEMAKLFNASFDINDLIERDLATVPIEIIKDLKMKFAPQINEFGTLNRERSSLAHLLDKHDINMTPKTFNAEVLRPLGMLTADNKVVDSGLYWGTNDVHSSKQGTTHPRWFDSRFLELIQYVKDKLNISL